MTLKRVRDNRRDNKPGKVGAMTKRMIKLCQRVKELAAQIHEDWIVHDRDWTQPGFRALLIHRTHAWLLDRGGWGRGVLVKLCRAQYRYVRNNYGIEIPFEAKVGRRVRIVHQAGIVFHWKTEIGDDCVVYQNVTLGATYSPKVLNKGPKVGNGVRIGAGAVVFAGITIGEGAIIGPNAVVMANVPAGARVVVEPPRVMVSRVGAKSEVADDKGNYGLQAQAVVR
jgi:serine O-acetyltransferase